MRRTRARWALLVIMALLLQQAPLVAAHGADDTHRCDADCACPISARPQPAEHHGSAHADAHGQVASGHATHAAAHDADRSSATGLPICSMRAACGSDGHPAGAPTWGGSAARPAVIEALDWAPPLPATERLPSASSVAPGGRTDSPPTPPPRSLSS